jgi:hypothetical protein
MVFSFFEEERMKADDFNQLVEDQFIRCIELLNGKAEEYAHKDDRLHNFKVAAGLQGITPREAIRGMMAKHTVCVYDMCKTDTIYPDALWDEKISDSINYLLLLKAIVQDEREVKIEDTKARLWEELTKRIESERCHSNG